MTFNIRLAFELACLTPFQLPNFNRSASQLETFRLKIERFPDRQTIYEAEKVGRNVEQKSFSSLKNVICQTTDLLHFESVRLMLFE